VPGLHLRDHVAFGAEHSSAPGSLAAIRAHLALEGRDVQVKRTVFAFILLCIIFAAGLHSALKPAHGANGDPGFPTGGQIFAQGYNRDRQTARFLSGLSTANVTSLATVLANAIAASPTQVYQLNGRPTIMVSARFSQSSTNTCKIRIVWLYT